MKKNIKLSIFSHHPSSFGSYAKVINNLCREIQEYYKISFCAHQYGWVGGRFFERPPFFLRKKGNCTAYEAYSPESRIHYLEFEKPDILFFVGDSWDFTNNRVFYDELYPTCVRNGIRLICYCPVHSVPLPHGYIEAAKNNCDFQLTMSKFGCDALIAQGVTREKSGFVYHGVDRSIFKKYDKKACRERFGFDPANPLVGYFAVNYDYRKMLPLAMMVFKKVQLKYPKAQLVLNSTSKGFWDLEEWKTSLRLKNVVLSNALLSAGTCDLSQEEIAMLYNSMDCYIHPSTSEGFGLTILEAMACAIPMVCTDLPVFKELYGDIPYYARSYKVIPTVWGSLEYLVDVDDMAEKVLYILNPENSREVNYRLKKGMEKASEYNWKSAADKLHYVLYLITQERNVRR